MNIPTHVLLSKVSRLPFFLWLLTCWSNPFICNSNVSCCYPILHIIWVFWECLTTPASSHLTCQVGLFQQITPRCIHTSKALRAHTACMQGNHRLKYAWNPANLFLQTQTWPSLILALAENTNLIQLLMIWKVFSLPPPGHSGPHVLKEIQSVCTCVCVYQTEDMI